MRGVSGLVKLEADSVREAVSGLVKLEADSVRRR